MHVSTNTAYGLNSASSLNQSALKKLTGSTHCILTLKTDATIYTDNKYINYSNALWRTWFKSPHIFIHSSVFHGECHHSSTV